MFEVGQKVWDVVRGEGVVVSVHSNQDYPVIVDLYSGSSESYTAGGLYQENHENPSLYPYPVEVVKKVTKPSINWNHVHSRFRWIAQDAEGGCWLYEDKPVEDEGEWKCSSGDCTSAEGLISLNPGTCDWNDSLVARPKDV
jgi:hypothetical protein